MIPCFPKRLDYGGSSGAARPEAAHAALAPRQLRTQAEGKVERLGVVRVLLLGLLRLPAFVLVAVVPMAVSLWEGSLA